jgi:hypothetical protein
MLAGIFAMLSVSIFGELRQHAEGLADRANAKMIVSTQRQALLAGARFTVTDSRDAIIREIIKGVRPSGIFRDRIFSVSGIDEQALARASRFVMLIDGGALEFDPQAAQPAM